MHVHRIDNAEERVESAEQQDGPRIVQASLPRGEDLPNEDGEPLETQRHRRQMNLLIESLELAWEERDDYYCSGNMFVFFSEAQVRNNDFRGPDVFVVLGTTKTERKSWVAWEEGGKLPDVVIEITSESTAKLDRGPKKEIYAKQFKTRAYYVYDPFTHELEGWLLDDELSYQPIAPNARGELLCPPLELGLTVAKARYLGAEHPWLRWVDGRGRMLPTQEEERLRIVNKAANEERRADEATHRADEATHRADEATHRADEATHRADEATHRAERAERELAELRARFDETKRRK